MTPREEPVGYGIPVPYDKPVGYRIPVGYEEPVGYGTSCEALKEGNVPALVDGRLDGILSLRYPEDTAVPTIGAIETPSARETVWIGLEIGTVSIGGAGCAVLRAAIDRGGALVI